MGTIITLGREEIEIFDLPIRKNKEWRRKALDGPLSAEKSFVKVGIDITDSYNGYLNFVDDEIEKMLELVLDFLPNQEKREYYADRATQPEVLLAFFELVRLAMSSDFFTVRYGEMFMTGSPVPQTGTNSPEANGESG